MPGALSLRVSVVERGFVLSLLLIAGCGTINSMVAPMALNPISIPSRGRTQVHVRQTTNTGVVPSVERGHAAFYLPRVQLEGGVGIRASRYFAMRIRVGTFFSEDAQRLTARTDDVPGRAGLTFGLTPTLTIPLDHARTLLTLAPDLTFALQPATLSDDRLCEDADGGTYACGSVDADGAMVGGTIGGAVAAFRWIDDRMRLGATVGVRPQPTLEHAFVSESPGVGHIAIVLGVEMYLQVSDGTFFSLESQWLGVVGPYFVFPTVGLTFGGIVADGPGQSPIDVSTWFD